MLLSTTGTVTDVLTSISIGASHKVVAQGRDSHIVQHVASGLSSRALGIVLLGGVPGAAVAAGAGGSPVSLGASGSAGSGDRVLVALVAGQSVGVSSGSLGRHRSAAGNHGGGAEVVVGHDAENTDGSLAASGGVDVSRLS